MESVKASILFQENVLIQTKPSFGDILRGGLCEQCPFFYGIDTVTDFSYVNCSHIN